jgi:hypothetical protein
MIGDRDPKRRITSTYSGYYRTRQRRLETGKAHEVIVDQVLMYNRYNCKEAFKDVEL